jgi:hypothetical protein
MAREEREAPAEQICSFYELVKNTLADNDNWIVLYSLSPCKTAATSTLMSFLKLTCGSQLIMINYHL